MIETEFIVTEEVFEHEVTEGIPLTINHINDKTVEFAVISDELVWRYVGATEWNSIYTLATLNGSDGREIELQTSGGYIQWRYVGDVSWTNLVALSAITGPQGPTGNNGADGTNGTNGADGTEIELQTSGGYIQWRYVGDVSWTNLVALTAITGPQGPTGNNGADGNNGVDGTEIELQTASGYIQWKYVGDVSWTNLVALTAITGPQGPTGNNGTNGADGTEIELQTSGGYIQWRYVGDVSWTNLVALTAITGPQGPTGNNGTNGADGADGTQIELQTSGGYIQWRYIGGSWTNLYAVSSILTTQAIGDLINSATAKTTPVDADMFGIMDSAASNILKKLSWSNIKSTLKSYFDSLYQAILVSGTNIKTVNSNSLLGSGDIAISGSGHTIQDETSGLTARANLNFTGELVTASDNAGTTTTDVLITSLNPASIRTWTNTFTVSRTSDIVVTYTAASAGDATIIANAIINRLCRWTASNGTTVKRGFVVNATASSTTVTINLNGDAFASGDINFRLSLKGFECKVSQWYVPGEQIADGTNPVGRQDVTLGSQDIYILSCSAYVGTAPAGSGADLGYDIYDDGTGIFTTDPSFTTNASVLNSIPNNRVVTGGSRLTLRTPVSAGATNKASDLNVLMFYGYDDWWDAV